jgi:hypothetical protein
MWLTVILPLTGERRARSRRHPGQQAPIPLFLLREGAN